MFPCADLQVLVVAELGATLQDDLLEQLDELVRQVGRHEGLDRRRDDVWVFGLWQRILHDGVDALAAVLILLDEDRRPQIEVLPLDEVARLLLEEAVPVGHVDKLRVAHAALVCDKGEVRVALLAILSHHLSP